MALLVTHRACLDHINPANHPESPDRLSAIEHHLRTWELWNLLTVETGRLATDAELCRTHTPTYLQRVRNVARLAGRLRGGTARISRDTWCSPGTFDAAAAATGSVLTACEAVSTGQHRTAFTMTRPPGHLAGRDVAAGGCIFNHAATAAYHCLQALEMQRVAILDIGRNPATGTRQILQDEPNVFLLSIHVGDREAEEANTDNLAWLPVARNAGGEKLLDRLIDALPRIENFSPNLLLVSMGFDAADGADHGSWDLESEHILDLSATICDLARACCDGRVVSILEEGYVPQALGPGVEAHLEALRQHQGSPDWVDSLKKDSQTI